VGEIVGGSVRLDAAFRASFPLEAWQRLVRPFQKAFGFKGFDGRSERI
jgi:hypothetical protein